MDKQVKRRWLRALRSGKYKRAQGQLKKGNGFCCLGVLCEVQNIPYNEWDHMPIDRSLNRIGLTWDDATYLTKLNDGTLTFCDRRPKAYRPARGMGFKSIADYISRHIKASS